MRRRSSSWRRFDPATLAVAPTRPAAVPAPEAGPCRILGLDPGSLRTGWGVVDCDGRVQRHVASGCIRTPASASMALRLRHIHESIAALVEQHAPTEIAVERVFLARNPDSALKLGQARGVAMCAAVLRGAALYEYAPRAVKLALVGTGAAEKAQVQHMVRAILGLTEAMGMDVSDALGLALCHAQSRRLGQVLAAASGGAGAGVPA